MEAIEGDPFPFCASLNDEIPLQSGISGEAADGIRTHDLLHGKQTL
jgi:hypothetical protein